MAGPITLGDRCPPSGYYVLYSKNVGHGPYDDLTEAIEHLRLFVCGEYAAPEFLRYVIMHADYETGTLGVAKRRGRIISGEYVRGNYPALEEDEPAAPGPPRSVTTYPLSITLSRADWETVHYALMFCVANVDEAMLEEFGRRDIEPGEWGVNEDDGLSDAKIGEILDQRMSDLENDLSRLKELLRNTLD